MRLIDADALMKTLGITDMDCEKCALRNKTYPVCNMGDGFSDACSAIEDAPTITIEGYDIDLLIGIAVVMRNEGVEPMEALNIFRDAKEVARMVIEEINNKVDKMIRLQIGEEDEVD